MIAADTLAAHAIFEFQAPSATYFCRLCYAQKAEIQEKFHKSMFEMRSSTAQ